MGNPNCYSYAMGKDTNMTPDRHPGGKGQAKPGLLAKHHGIIGGSYATTYQGKLIVGVMSDLRQFKKMGNQVKHHIWEEGGSVPALNEGQRIIAMIYWEHMGWHFWRKDGDVWTSISGVNPTPSVITEENLKDGNWGEFNPNKYKRGGFIELPIGEYFPLYAGIKEWWVA